VQAYGARRDGETEAGSAGVRVARFLNPVKWAENICEHFFRHAGAVIVHADDGTPFAVRAPALKRDIDGRAFVRVPQPIANNILDGAQQQRICSRRSAVVARGDKVKDMMTAQNTGATDDVPPSPPLAQSTFERVAADLDLSQAQRTEIKAIIIDEFAAVEPLLQKFYESREQLEAATANGRFDEEEVHAIAAQQAQAITELIVAKERAKAKIFGVLTPDQRAKVNQMVERVGAERAAPSPLR
jgi:Spy/CpxP family protein refolding chaperone